MKWFLNILSFDTKRKLTQNFNLFRNRYDTLIMHGSNETNTKILLKALKISTNIISRYKLISTEIFLIISQRLPEDLCSDLDLWSASITWSIFKSETNIYIMAYRIRQKFGTQNKQKNVIFTEKNERTWQTASYFSASLNSNSHPLLMISLFW